MVVVCAGHHPAAEVTAVWRLVTLLLFLLLQQAAVDSSDYTTSAAIPVVRFTEHDFRLHPAYERPAVLALSREEVRHALTHRNPVGFST